MTALEQPNALLASEPPSAEAEVEIWYTLPTLHDEPDDKLYFDRMLAIQAFPHARCAGEA